MILIISGIKLFLGEGEETLAAKSAAILSLPQERLVSLKISRKSLDARRNRPPFFVYVVEAVVPDDTPLPDVPEAGVSIRMLAENGTAYFLEDDAVKNGRVSWRRVFAARQRRKVVVIGGGPAGLFAALALAEKGLPVLLLERGSGVARRRRDVRAFWEKGRLSPESNVHFGEGGAGTFSDGKLTSRAKDPRVRFVKETFVELGAPANILIDAKPHVGTDKLREVVTNFRKKLLALGCEIRFGARVSDLLMRDGRASGVVVNGEEAIDSGRIVLAPGQSADDTYRMLHDRGVRLGPKPFALGLRVEHPQELINEIQYGRWRAHAGLPPAEYFLTAAVPHLDRSVYTFCMCPGGSIIGSSSEKDGVITNGMSGSLRDGFYANSAVVVNVRDADFAGTDRSPLAGLNFRRKWENTAFLLGGGDYYAPAQRLTDFLRDRESDKLAGTSFRPGVRAALLKESLPRFAAEALKEGMRLFERKMPGFVTEEAMLVGVETRTSSPVRILRDARGQSVSAEGLYPCGEGAGYAGGIVSSALDGIKTAEKIIAALEARR